MDDIDNRYNRGQITIEAILILGLFILIFVGVTFNMGMKVRGYSNDVAIASEAKANLDKIADGIMIVRAGGPGTTKVVTITSTFNNWGIATGSWLGRDAAIIYGIGFNSTGPIPDEMNATSGQSLGLYWGSLERNISGVSKGANVMALIGNGSGTWKIRIKYDIATTLTPKINLAPAYPASGETINVTLTS